MVKLQHFINEKTKQPFYQWAVYAVVKDVSGTMHKMFIDYFALEPSYNEAVQVIKENQAEGIYNNIVL